MDYHKCSNQCSSHSPRFFDKFLRYFLKKQPETVIEPHKIPRIALVGMPNVGKSVVFNGLTGTYVTVSNYPGTTVEISRGEMKIGNTPIAVVDTPGMYSLIPITEEEKVSRDLLMGEWFDLVIHVVDAKNLSRMLPLTFQLIETGLPVLLAINMMDEARQLGLAIQTEDLETKLGIPIVTMAAALNQGLRLLKERIINHVESSNLSATNRERHFQNRVSIL
ncbi:Fe(2+) transporter FeoB [Planktothrix rubescens]|jgi:ferrous iron transport protein B|nr:Fe(2+) transporter FeoB [Planktothrix rubescens]